jgi:hypothetical protein
MKLPGKTKTVLATFLLSVGLLAAPASAVMITNWDYEVNSGFSAFSPVFDPVTAPFAVQSANPGTLGGLPTRLSWGQTGTTNTLPNPALQSFLDVTDPIIGTGADDVVTNGPEAPGAVLTHGNFVINRNTTDPNRSLETATLTTQLTLDPTAPPEVAGIGPIGPLGPIDFNILFEETRNAGPCPSGAVPCPDIFVLTNPEALDFLLPGASLPAPANDFDYTISLRLEGLTTLQDPACAAVGEGAGCQGLLTQENLENSFQAFFQITARPVNIPEPATLGMLGLILAGLGAVGLRRHRG